MAPVTMKDDALPQIHLVRDTDLGVFAYELHILAGDFLRESEFNLRSLATNTGPDVYKRQPVDISTPLTWFISACPDRWPSTLRNSAKSSSGKYPLCAKIG